mgnify:CR=1 FL=1|jgi:serine/threonine protein phosphatase PrpC
MGSENFQKKYRVVASITDVGIRRENNEDSILILDGAGCYAVSDGMGGGSAGEIASSAVVTYIRNAIGDAPMLPKCRRERMAASVYSAHDAILKYAQKHEYESMGATVAALLLDPWKPNRADIYFAGDSRIYRLRGKSLEILSYDHTISNASGIPEKNLPPYMAGLLSNAVGIRSGFFLASASVDVQENDIFLLCSDGLYRQIAEDQMIRSLVREKNLDVVLNTWVKTANTAQGLDNLSAILIRFSGLPEKYSPDVQEQKLNDTPEPAADNRIQAESQGDTVI